MLKIRDLGIHVVPDMTRIEACGKTVPPGGKKAPYPKPKPKPKPKKYAGGTIGDEAASQLRQQMHTALTTSA